MKKYLLFILFILLIIPFSVRGVYAMTPCDEVEKKISDYKEIESEITDLSCESSPKKENVALCNQLSSELNLVLTDLFEIYEEDTYCDLSELTPIINQNKNRCTKDVSDKINSLAKTGYRYFYIIGTFLFIIFGSLDFFKNIIQSSPEKLAKNRKNFFKRMIALLLIYFLPMILNYIFYPNHLKLGTNKYICVATIYNESGKVTPSESTKEKDTKEKEKKVKTNTKTYGAAKGSKVIAYKNKKYVVVDTKYPGGVVGYQKMLLNNDITQSKLKSNHKDVKNAGGCCGGISQIQACGLYKGKTVTVSNVKKGYTTYKGEKVSACNNSNNGCSGGYGSGKCYGTEQAFVEAVIKQVRNGHPVVIAVATNKNKKTTTRHFVTVVGFKENTDGTTYKDLLILDSYTGSLKSLGSSSRTINGKGVKIQNHPCKSNTKNFASTIK